MQTKSFFGITLGLLITVWAGCLPAQERGTDPSRVLEAVSGSSGRQTVPFGVPLAPPIYFTNFLFGRSSSLSYYSCRIWVGSDTWYLWSLAGYCYWNYW